MVITHTRVRQAGLAEWQTRSTQNALSERACGFKSHIRHTNLEDSYGLFLADDVDSQVVGSSHGSWRGTRNYDDLVPHLD